MHHSVERASASVFLESIALNISGESTPSASAIIANHSFASMRERTRVGISNSNASSAEYVRWVSLVVTPT